MDQHISMITGAAIPPHTYQIIKNERFKTMATVAELVTNEIIKRLEAGTIPWFKPWSGVDRAVSYSQANILPIIRFRSGAAMSSVELKVI